MVAQRGPGLKAGALPAGSPPRPTWPPLTHGTATLKHLPPSCRGQRAKGPNVVASETGPTIKRAHMVTCPRDRTRRPGGRAVAKAKATARGVYPV